MSIIWSPQARDDVDRLVQFVAEYNAGKATELEEALRDSPKHLARFPRRGPRVWNFTDREVRELHVGRHLLRYELADGDILVLRFFHVREDRS